MRDHKLHFSVIKIFCHLYRTTVLQFLESAYIRLLTADTARQYHCVQSYAL